MKKTNLFLILLSPLFFSLSTPLLAVDVNNSPVDNLTKENKVLIQTLKEDRKATKSAIKNTQKNIRTDFKETRKAGLTELKRKKIESLYKTIRTGLIQRYELLNSSKTKIENRIKEKETAGSDVSEIRTKFSQYDKYLISYKSNLESLDAEFQKLINAEKPATYVDELKIAANKVRSDLNSMRKILSESLRMLIKL